MQRTKQTTFLIFILFAFVCRASIAQDRDTLSLNLTNKALPFGLSEKVPVNLPQIGLALSGGGARSFAQLGVLKALEEKKIPIDIITGTSMGSIVGGLYSAGYSIADLDSIIQTAPWSAFFSIEESDRNELFVDKKITEDKAIIAFRLEGLRPVIPTAVNTGQRVANFLNLLSINAPIHIQHSFDELLYKFRAISTNLVTGNEVILSDGLISQAMRASSSVSLLLEPVKIDTVLLADGGLVANVPVKSAEETGADYVIAVNSTSPLHGREALNYPWNIADQMVSIPMKELNDAQLAQANAIITPNLGYQTNTDFSRNDFIINEGYKTALPLVDSIAAGIKKIYKDSLTAREFCVYHPRLADNPTKLECAIFQKYLNRDSLNSRELYYDLYTLEKTGDYENVNFALDHDSAGTTLHIIASENPIVKEVSLNGVIIIDFEKADKELEKLTGKPFNSRKTLKSILNLLRLYRNAGFSLAEVESVNFNKTNGVLQVNISEGIINNIIVEGNTKTDSKLITREFPIQEGEYFRYSNLEDGLTNLRATNLFENIELFLIKDFDENILKVKINEKVSSLIRLGVRIDNENYTQALIDIRDENIFGSGTELGLLITGGVRNQSFTIEHRANRVFNTYLTYSLKGFYKAEKINVYYDDKTAEKSKIIRNKVFEYEQSFLGASFGVGTQIAKFGNIILEGKYQHSYVGSIPGQSQPLESNDVFSLKLILTIDSQNRFPYPNTGQYLNAYYETAQTIFSGDLGFSKFYLDYKVYFPVIENSTVNTRLKIGISDKTLPLSEFFSIGGQNSFFGLRDNEFRDRQLFVASCEYQYKLPFKLFVDTYLRFHYDLGSTWAVPEQIRYKDLRHGIGATLSLDTPLGPADFSIGKSFTFINEFPNSTIIAWGKTFFYFTIGYYY